MEIYDYGEYLEIGFKGKVTKVTHTFNEVIPLLGNNLRNVTGVYTQLSAGLKFIDSLLFFKINGGTISQELKSLLLKLASFLDSYDNITLRLLLPEPDMDFVLFGNEYSPSTVLSVLNNVAYMVATTATVDNVFKNRIDNYAPSNKVFFNNEVLFKCVHEHYSCEVCKVIRYKVRSIFKGTPLELLLGEGITGLYKANVKSGTQYPFLHDILILAACIDDKNFSNQRGVNLFINDTRDLLHKINIFMLDLLIFNYGIDFVSQNRYFIDNSTVIIDRFITLLLLRNDFDFSLIKGFGVDAEFLLGMFTTKFNLDEETFSYTKIENFTNTFTKCLKFVYDNTEGIDVKMTLIMEICNAFTFTNPEWKWKMLDIIFSLQEGLPLNRYIIPIIYEEEPQGGYWIGKYLKKQKTSIVFDIAINKTFVFNSQLTKVDENRRVIELYNDIKEKKHPYFIYSGQEFLLPQDVACRSNLVFHIYCDLKTPREFT